MKLRDYQESAVSAAISWCKYKSEPCIIDIATGGGKTHIINALAEHFFKLGERVCIIAHRKELLEQTGGKLSIPFGYYSASIGEKNTAAQVIIAGIQSIYDKADIEKFNVVIVDECHRVPNNEESGQYWRFIGKHQPCKIIGLTATPFRMNGGKLGWGEVIYDAKYPLLQSLGYLTKITNKVKNTPDLSSVKVTAGEFNESELSHVMEDPALIDLAVKNIIAFSAGRESILIFCVTVSHAKLLTEVMQRNGLDSALIHGETPKGERETILNDFKDGRLRHLLNCEILLEGFDAPNVDMIVCLRPTKSKALHEQMLGRGVRLFEGKQDCFLLDMAGNLMEHGGLGTPFYEKSKKESKKEKGRICPACETFNKPTAKQCDDCGFVFPKEDPHKASHNQSADFESDAEYIPLTTYTVKSVLYREHRSKKGNTTLRVDYVCNTKYGAISEYLSPHSENEWARNNAWKFFRDRGWEAYGDIKDYSMEDLLFHALMLKQPVEITVDHNEKYPRIKGYTWAEPVTIEEPKSTSDLLDGDEVVF